MWNTRGGPNDDEGRQSSQKVGKRRVFICKGCQEFTTENLRAVRAHFGRSKECKKLYNEQTDDSGRFYSTVEVRVGPQDHQAGGQSMRPGLVQRISHQSTYISGQTRTDIPAAVDEMELEGIPSFEKYLKNYFLS